MEANDKDFWSYDPHPKDLAPFTEPLALFTKTLTTKIKQIHNPVSFRSIEIFIFFKIFFTTLSKVVFNITTHYTIYAILISLSGILMLHKKISLEK